MTEPAAHWRQTLRARLMTARKDRDAIRVSALRSALSAIDNAETPDVEDLDVPAAGTVAGSVAGLGAAEVPRRVLPGAAIRTLLRAEIDDRLLAAEQMDAGGHSERATAVRAEAAVLVDLLSGG
ncbi:MAG: uncharacterized protein QOH54_4740 [Mycobacterium sp.]|jgi:uncharacterized protein YqeY|nr:uncharacterized protein [Mycobacterium sp.]